MAAKKVLIADDEHLVCNSLKNILEKDGFQVSIANNGKEALRLTESLKPDVILLDIVMPDIDGFEFCEIVNKDPSNCSIPIIITSALAKEADKIKAFKLGVVDYLVKPLEVEKVKKAIERALRFKQEE